MEITRSRNKCFDDIASYLPGLIYLTLGIELSKQGSADPYAPNHAVGLSAKQVGKKLVIYPHTLLNEAFTGRGSTTPLIMDEEPDPVPVSAILKFGPLEKPFLALEQSMFIGYFERERPQITAKYRGVKRWPADWNFARIVRNAAAHNNEVRIDDPKAAPVTWHGLTYAPADNGRKVLHVDLWPADLIYLMMDLDAHLR